MTIVELMVVLGILSTLCALLVQLTGATQGVVGSNIHRMDSDGQAQMSFDRISLDIEGIPYEEGAPWILENGGPGKVFLKFLTTVPSQNGDRKLSIVAYRVATDASSGMLSLQRAAKGVDWSENVMGVKADGTAVKFEDLSPSLALSDADYDVLAIGVIRMAVSCQRRDTGAIQANLPFTAAGNPDFSKVAGIILTTVVVDGSAAQLLTPAQIEGIAATFSDPSEGSLPGTEWNQLANTPEFFQGIPGVTARSLRIYQRFFPVGPKI